MEDFITDVNLNLLVSGNSNRLAYGNVTLFNKVKINISIVKSNAGEAFVSWPSYTTEKDGVTKWNGYIYFPEQEDRNYVNEAILQAFNRLIEPESKPEPKKETVVEPKKDIKKTSVWSKKDK